MAKIAVITILYQNERSDVFRFVRWLAEAASAATSVEVSLFILDNSPEPVLSESDRDALTRYIDISFVNSIGNVGFACGVNFVVASEGISEKFDGILLLNSDGLPHRDFLRRLVGFRSSDLRSEIREGAQFPSEHPKLYDLSTGKASWVSGCALLIGVDAFERLGGFDQDFFMYMEDVDLSFRAIQLGIGMYYEPAALYYHPIINRVETLHRKRLIISSALQLYRKWGDRIHEAGAWHTLKALQVDPEELLANLAIGSRQHGVFRDNFRYVYDDLRW
jgi:GT2 family glycosyltransferase